LAVTSELLTKNRFGDTININVKNNNTYEQCEFYANLAKIRKIINYSHFCIFCIKSVISYYYNGREI